MATTLKFLILGDDKASAAFNRFARSVDNANRSVDRNNAVLKKQSDGLKRQADGLAKLMSSAPAWLGPALVSLPAVVTLAGTAAGAVAGLAGAGIAAGGALAAFGVVAVPVLKDAKTAAGAVEKAQNNYSAAIAAGTPKARAYKAEQLAISKAYAGMSPQQITLSKQLGAMAGKWDKVKASLTPVVSGALQPWLKAVTDSFKFLKPIVDAVAPVIKNLGDQFGWLINSAGFKKFAAFIAGTGSAAVGALGSTLIDFLNAAIILLPKFNPLIEKAVGWIGDLGPAVLAWASSKKTSDDITKFMAWFNKNGKVVGDLLKNLGSAIKNLAPGLAAGGQLQLKVISDFLGLVAKLPKGIAGPLAEVAGAALVLAKLPGGQKVISFLVTGALGGVFKGTGAAGAAASATTLTPLMSRIFGAGVIVAAGVLTAELVVKPLLQQQPSGTIRGTSKQGNWWDNPFGGNPKSKQAAQQGVSTWAGLGNLITQIWDTMWRNTITRTARGFHDIAGWFDTGRHWIAARAAQTGQDIANWWNISFNNTIGRIQRGFHDIAHWFDVGRHNIAAGFSNALTWLTGVGKNIIGGLWTGIGIAWRTVSGWFSGLGATIIGFFQNCIGWLAEKGKNIIRGLWGGIQAIWQNVSNFFRNIPSAILHALSVKSPPQWAVDAGKHIMTGLFGWTDTKKHQIMAKVSNLGSTVGGTVASTAAVMIGRQLAAAYGWGGGLEWDSLFKLWMGESGWNPLARNASSGAYGIPQALPASKMGSAGPDWLTNPATQIKWGLAYIKAVYGDPLVAFSMWLSRSPHWYGAGGLITEPILGFGRSGRMYGFGERGPETVTPGRGHGDTYILNVNVPESAHPAETGRRIARYLREYKRTGGKY